MIKKDKVSKDWVALEISRSTKDFATRQELTEVNKRIDSVFEKLGSKLDWRWCLGALVTVIIAFFKFSS